MLNIVGNTEVNLIPSVSEYRGSWSNIRVKLTIRGESRKWERNYVLSSWEGFKDALD